MYLCKIYCKNTVKTLLVIILSFMSITTWADDTIPSTNKAATTDTDFKRQETRKADALFEAQRYKEARQQYRTLLETTPANQYLNYKMGACCFYANDMDAALAYLNTATSIPGAVFLSGDAYARKYDFAGAKKSYSQTSEMASTTTYLRNACKRRLEGIDNAERMMRNIEDIEILGYETRSKKDFFSYYDLGDNAGLLYSSVDNDNDYAVPYSGHLTEREDRKIFTDTAGNTSNLYISDKLLEGWSTPKALPQNINTEGNENFPFLSEDGLTLYFGSTRHGSIGGYDIFVTRKNTDNNTYYTPVQMGMPFNSPWNDYLLALDEAHGIGYWASDRYQHGDSVIIYKFKIKDHTEYIADTLSLNEKENRARLNPYWLKQSQDKAKTPDTIQSDTTKEAKATEVPQQPERQKIEIQSSGFVFKIIDGITYTKLEDFKSGEARAYYQQGAKIQAQRDANIKELEEKRRAYSQATDATEKKRISTDILRLEKRLGAGVQSSADKSFKIARNYEIRQLRQQK